MMIMLWFQRKEQILQFDDNDDDGIFVLPNPLFIRTALPVRETTVMRGNYVDHM